MEGERRVILFPLPLEGHINPMLQLGNILHWKGFSISVIHTTFNALDPSKHPNFAFHRIHEGLTREEASTTDIVSLLAVLNAKCASPLRDCLSSLLRNDNSNIACLISDAIFHFTQSVADPLDLPRIVLRTGGASSFVVFAAFPFLRERGYLPIKETTPMEEPVVEFPPLKVKDLPVISTRDPETMYHLVANMVKEAKASSGLIWNTFQELEEAGLAKLVHEIPVPIFPIGPFHKHPPGAVPPSTRLLPDQGALTWLDKQPHNSVVYVSFGSIVSLKESDFSEIAWGLYHSEQPILWVVRPGLVHGTEWVEALGNGLLRDFGERGCIVKWAPQVEVLAHPAVGAFWTHNGWNSTLESVSAGVPMICMPCFTDQKVNARYVADVWRAGLMLEDGIERGKIAGLIKKLMREKEGKEIRSRVLGLKEKANLCLGEGGSSTQSLDRLISHILSLV